MISFSPLHHPSVHPHARGDNLGGSAPTIISAGSPPRAWGQLHQRGASGRQERFTPTRVGTTCLAYFSNAVESVHPHARGDNAPLRSKYVAYFGSPPRAWGQPVRLQQRRPSARFTPTRVGTTASATLPQTLVPVHPHARGDNSEVGLDLLQIRGSPPRAWGQRWNLA